MTLHDLIYKLIRSPLGAKRVRAKTPHGTYTFSITDVEVDGDDVVLCLTEVAA